VHHLGHQKRSFKPWFQPIGGVLVGMLEVLYGHVPGQYPIGHVRVHHKFDNGPEDLTSTMGLDRGSFSGWLRYRQQFLLFWSGTSIVHFFLRRGQRDPAWIQLRGMLVFYGVLIAACIYNPELGFAYFVLPSIVIVNFISAINFTWHMFIDPRDAGDAVLLLPAKTRYEQDDGGTETTTERRVIFSPELPRPASHPVGEARAEWKILLDLAAAAYPDRAHQLGCETGPLIRQEIAKIIPAYAGIKDLKESGDQFQYGGARLCENFNFPTPDHKAHFRAVPLPDTSREAGTFRLTTRRGKQFNTLIYAETDPLTGASRDAVFMNPDDAADLRLKQGDRVTLVNARARYDARVHLAPLAAGTLQAHWPEANVLIETGVEDPVGRVPDYNATVRVEKAGS